MTRQIFAAEINFKEIPFSVHENFIGTEKNIKRLLTSLRPFVDEVFILGTRKRFTVYVVNENLSPLTDFFHTQHNLKGYAQLYYNTSESVTHLMATASGLLSPIKGEGNVLNDIVNCYQWATETSALGVTLDNTLTKAIETGRAVRTATGIDKFCASAVETGIDLLYNQLEDLHRKNFLIVGTGLMARLALEYLSGEGMRNIAVTGYDYPAAVELAKRFKVRAVQIENVVEYFVEADIILGVSAEEVKIEFSADQKQQLEKNQNRFVLDLGMPPNFDEQWLEAYAEGFYNLDDLRRIQPSPLEAFGGLEAAWRIVMHASNEFVHLLQLLNHSPVLTAYLNRQFSLKNREWKTKPKRTLKSLLLFRKQDSVTGISSVSDNSHARVHANNYLPQNGYEIVRNVSNVKKFNFYLKEN